MAPAVSAPSGPHFTGSHSPVILLLLTCKILISLTIDSYFLIHTNTFNPFGELMRFKLYLLYKSVFVCVCVCMCLGVNVCL